jgi:hypothetical protein
MAFYEIFPEDFDDGDIDHDGQGCGLIFWFAGQRPGSNLCFDSSLYRNNGDLTTMNPPEDWIGGHHGTALDFDGSNDWVGLRSFVIPNALTAAYTVSLWFKSTTAGRSERLFSQRSSTNDSHNLWIQTNEIGYTLYNGTGHNGSVAFTDTTNWHHLVGVHFGSASVAAYLDGVPITGNVTRTTSNTSGTTAIGAGVGGAQTFLGAISDVRVYNRALTAGEVWDLYSNPTGILLPQRKVLKRNAAAGAFSIVAGSGSYSLTGTAATLKFGRLLSAGSGSFSVTGSAAGVLFGRKLTANSGSFSITGTAATPKFGRLLSAGSGTYLISGKSANLNFSGAQLRKYQFLLRRALWRMK